MTLVADPIALNHDGEDGPTDQKHARTPAIGQCAESELRDGAGELVTHRQQADGRSERPSRGISSGRSGANHVAVGVGDEMR